jgi:hypothetical protein
MELEPVPKTCPQEGHLKSSVARVRPSGCLSETIGLLDRAREFDGGCDTELAEDVAQVGLDSFQAEKELCGDLRVGLSFDYRVARREIEAERIRSLACRVCDDSN